MTLAPNALTTLEAVKDQLTITDTDSDNILMRLINSASAFIENYCSRMFGIAQVTETYMGNNRHHVVLLRRPVVSVDEVKAYDVPLSSDDYSLERNDMLYREHGWKSIGFDIEVTYTAGCVLPKDATDESPRTLPYDLEDACITLVASKWRKREDVAEGKTDVSQGAYKMSFDMSDISADVKVVLNQYRALVF